jgi:hypothetical protein
MKIILPRFQQMLEAAKIVQLQQNNCEQNSRESFRVLEQGTETKSNNCIQCQEKKKKKMSTAGIEPAIS